MRGSTDALLYGEFTLTRSELASLIRRKPEVFGRYRAMLKSLPPDSPKRSRRKAKVSRTRSSR